MIHQTVHNYYSGVLNLLFVVSIRSDKTKHYYYSNLLYLIQKYLSVNFKSFTIYRIHKYSIHFVLSPY